MQKRASGRRQARAGLPDCECYHVMATNPPSTESNVFRFYSEIETLDPAAVAKLLWQDGVLTFSEQERSEVIRLVLS